MNRESQSEPFVFATPICMNLMIFALEVVQDLSHARVLNQKEIIRGSSSKMSRLAVDLCLVQYR